LSLHRPGPLTITRNLAQVERWTANCGGEPDKAGGVVRGAALAVLASAPQAIRDHNGHQQDAAGGHKAHGGPGRHGQEPLPLLAVSKHPPRTRRRPGAPTIGWPASIERCDRGTPALAVQASGSRPGGDRGPLCAAVPCPVEPPIYPGGPRPGRAASKHDWAAAAPGGLMPGGCQPEPVISRGTTIPGAGLLRPGPGQVATERPGSVQCHRTWCRAPSCTAPAASRARSSSCSAVAG
jgi:hypothetical protein